MVKGINRRIVEIKNPNNEYFEKVLLFVREDRSGLSTEFLTRQADIFSDELISNRTQIYYGKKKMKNILVASLTTVLVLLGIASLLVFL